MLEAGSRPLDDDDVAWLKGYAAEVEREFDGQFKDAADRFPEAPKLLARFTAAVGLVLKRGRTAFRGIDGAHNELCIAGSLLANKNPKFVRLEYEPPLEGSPQSIDFRASSDSKALVYVDVKTIKPVAKDRWDQYEKAQRESLFPPLVKVVIGKEWLGGELWHGMVCRLAVRRRQRRNCSRQHRLLC